MHKKVGLFGQRFFFNIHLWCHLSHRFCVWLLEASRHILPVPETWQCAAGSSAGWPWRPPGWRPTSWAGPPSSRPCHKKTPAPWLCSAAAGRPGPTPGPAPLPFYTAHPETPSEPGQTVLNMLKYILPFFFRLWTFIVIPCTLTLQISAESYSSII